MGDHTDKRRQRDISRRPRRRFDDRPVRASNGCWVLCKWNQEQEKRMKGGVVGGRSSTLVQYTIAISASFAKPGKTPILGGMALPSPGTSTGTRTGTPVHPSSCTSEGKI